MRPLKILYSYVGVSYDESARYIHHLMQAMRTQEHIVEAYCTVDSALALALKADNFKVYEEPIVHGLAILPRVLKVRKHLKQQNYDVVNSNAHADTGLTALAARLAGVPLVVRTYHQVKTPSSTLTQNRIPHRTIANNQFMRKQLLQRGIKASTLAVIHDAVIIAEQKLSSNLREKLGLDAKSLLIATVAELSKGSGALELIQAMAPLLREQPQLHVLVQGTGVQKSQLEAFAQQLEVLAQVHFMAESIDLKQIDVFVFVPYEADSAMIIAQAGAAKRPVIGTRVGAIPEMMAQGKSGMLVPLHDIVALRKALVRLLDDAELRQQMGQAGYEHVRGTDRFLLTTMQQQTEQAYKRWLEQLR